jgi:hypothetical protein
LQSNELITEDELFEGLFKIGKEYGKKQTIPRPDIEKMPHFNRKGFYTNPKAVKPKKKKAKSRKDISYT